MIKLLFAIVDVNPWHLQQLWRRICIPSGFFPDLWVGPAESHTLISFVKGITDYDYIALPIQSLNPIYLESSANCIIHRDSRIESKLFTHVTSKPASSAVVYKLLEIWRNSHVT